MKANKTYRPNETETALLMEAARSLKSANENIASETKRADIAKAVLARFVCERETMNGGNEPDKAIKAHFDIGSIFMLTGIAMLEIGKQNKLDEKSLAADLPETYLKYNRDVATAKFKPLV